MRINVDMSDVYNSAYGEQVALVKAGMDAITARIFEENFLDRGLTQVDDIVGEVDQPNATTYRFRRRLLDHLIDAGDVRVDGDGEVVASPALRQRARDMECILAQTAQHAELTPALDFYDRVRAVAARIVNGVDGFDAIVERFGFEDSLAAWGDLQMRFAVKRPCNVLLARALVERLKKGRPLTVFEGGAGLGVVLRHALEEPSFPEIAGNIEQYFHTDISPGLLRMGAEALQQSAPKRVYNRIVFQRLDLDDLAAGTAEFWQGRSVDVILLESVIYDLKHLEQALKAFRRMLRPDGILVFSAIYRQRPASFFPYEAIQSTLRSYNRAVLEPGLRESYGHLGLDEWQRVLSAAGFADYDVFPPATDQHRWPCGGVIAYR